MVTSPATTTPLFSTRSRTSQIETRSVSSSAHSSGMNLSPPGVFSRCVTANHLLYGGLVEAPPKLLQPLQPGDLRLSVNQRLLLFRERPRSEEHTSELQSLRHLVC